MNDLLIISVALEQGVYIKEVDGTIKHVDSSQLLWACGGLKIVNEKLYGEHYEVIRSLDIGDYRKTWSLQKEDLYEES